MESVARKDNIYRYLPLCELDKDQAKRALESLGKKRGVSFEMCTEYHIWNLHVRRQWYFVFDNDQTSNHLLDGSHFCAGNGNVM